MSLRIHTLGPFRVHRGDTPIPDSAWKTQKNKALLKILLTHRGHALTRDQLMEWLWRDMASDAAGRNLRVAISQLRRVLEPDLPPRAKSSFVLTTDAGYAWNTQADYWLDAEEFEGLADSRWQIADGDHQPSAITYQPPAISHMQSAISLYQGDYLEEDRYADWATAERERLRELYFALLTRLAEAYARQGRYQRAVASCREVLAADRCRESVWCQLMLYHYHAGDQALALRAYEACRQALAEELGVDPLPETSALFEQILRHEIPAPSRAIPNNLPQQLTSFVGREAELGEIAKRLEDPSCRLLTLVGPGGIGKTRLALHAAMDILAQYPHGVYFVPLAPLGSADFMVSTIADVLKFSFYGREDPKVQLLNYLREKEMLLVMDNFEHLLDGSGLPLEILQHAPKVKILVTSREPLNFQAEWLLDIGGLPFPAERNQVSWRNLVSAEVEGYSAVQLFLERAGRVRVGFSLSEAATRDVIRICQFLEGMPLGIELAAAWVREFSCKDIAREIERNLDYLKTSMQDVPERHRSLRAVFDWSWNLLSEQERSAFRRLSVFRGGFQSEAAEQVAGASAPLLSSLVDKSLLRQTVSGRYQIHQLLRQYAAEKLGEVPQEEETAQDGHCRYYATFLHQREDHLKAERQKEALEEVGEEIENIRKGWTWAVERVMPEDVGRFLESLYLFYWVRGRFHEGEEAFERAVERLVGDQGYTHTPQHSSIPAQKAAVVLGNLLARQGKLCFRLGLYEKASELLHGSLDIFRDLGAHEEMAFSLHTLGYVAYMLGEYLEARQRCQESLSISKQVGDTHGMTRCLNTLGLVARGLGEFMEAKRLHERSLTISRQIGDERTTARSLAYLGLTATTLGEYKEAKQLCQESLEIFRRIGDPWATALALDYRGHVARALGEYAGAKQLYQESFAIRKEIDNRWGIAAFFINVGDIAYILGDYTEAEQLYQQSLVAFKEIGDRPGIASNLRNLGLIARTLGEHGKAKELLQESFAAFTEINNRAGIVSSLRSLGDLACALGENQDARACFHEALEIAMDICLVPEVLEILIGIATLLVEEGERGPALELLAFALHHSASTRQTQDRAERLLSKLESQLSPEVVAEAQQRGEARTLDAIVEEMLVGTLVR